MCRCSNDGAVRNPTLSTLCPTQILTWPGFGLRCNMVQYGAIWCNMVQYGAIKFVQTFVSLRHECFSYVDESASKSKSTRCRPSLGYVVLESVGLNSCIRGSPSAGMLRILDKLWLRPGWWSTSSDETNDAGTSVPGCCGLSTQLPQLAHPFRACRCPVWRLHQWQWNFGYATFPYLS